MKTINFFRSKLFALTLALVASVSSFAYDEMPDFQVDGLYYNFLEGDNVEVTHPYIPVVPVENVASNTKKKSHAISADDYYNLTNLVIPSTVTYEGKVYKVTRIGFDAFNQCDKLTFVDIPSSVKTIGVGAFNFCSSLTSITLKEGLEHIEWNAFEDCKSLENITFPNSLKTIGNYAFSNTLWYKNHPNGAVYASNVFYKYKGDIPQNTSFVIKEGTVSISPYAFVKENYHEDYSLVSVSIPNSVKVIGEGVFYRCRALTSIVIPDGVTTIETLAFHYCKALNSVTCKAVEPPVLGSSVFSVVPLTDATLYVPAESVDAYKNADQWKDFGQILPIEPTSYKSQWCDTWNVMWFDGMFFDETASTSQYRLGKDTVIGDYTYSKFTSRTSVRFTDDRKVYVYYEGFDDNDPYTVDLPTGEYLAYDFSAQVGDTLEVFSGIGTYSTYPCVVDDVETAPSPCVVDDVQADLKTFPLIIKLHPLCDVDGEGNMEISSEEITWIEGVGSPDGFLISSLPCGWVGGGTYALLCAYKGDELKYTGSLYDEYGCEYNANDPHLPLVDWCNQWNILSHGYQGPQDPLVAARTSIFWLSNNTVNRDGQEYIPLMCSSSKPDVESTNLIGELRFTEDKQVYFYYDNTEYLLYDFDVQVGDTLDIFGGIELYSYSFVEQKTYPHVITKIDTLDDGRLQITSDAIVIFEDGEVGTFEEKQQQIWIEGLGSINGIVHTGINPGIGGNPAIVMLCAYRDDECVYKTDSNDPYWIDYTQLGCVYNAGDFIEGAFPMLSGLQRTICNEYCEDSKTSLQKFDEIRFEHDQPYIYCESAFLIREENNKILIYSHSLDKDLVLYDFTLEVGDSLPRLYLDESAEKDLYWIYYNIMNVVDYHKDLEGNILPADTLIVTDVSAITLLDGKEYKKWTFNNGMEYVEGIGSFGNNMWFCDFFQLIGNMAFPVSLHGTHLVCVSKNGKLLYQMDDAEMERLGAECLCDYDRGPRKDNAKDGQIGGRPTPTQWNQLELDLRKMDNGTTILRAETFSYTLENDSIVANDKIFYQLARQSTKDTATTKSFVGALHFGKDEDNRVYFLRDGIEYVLYDFTAEPGDTVEIFAGINNYPQDSTYTHVVVDKDTTEDGACRMFLEVVFPEETTTATNAEKVWLAGLGSIDGIVHNTATRISNAYATPARSANSETQTSVMLCAWREDSCLYITDHPDYNDIGCIYNQDPTSIEDTHGPSPIADYQKLLRDGQLLIIHKGKTYNVLGVQVK